MRRSVIEPFEFDRRLAKEAGIELLCGVDEAGRGCLAGPVVAAAVVVNVETHNPVEGVTDSKQLSFKDREELAALLKDSLLAWTIGVASWRFIDQHNIRQGALRAMKRAVKALEPTPQLVVVDGRDMLDLPLRVMPMVKGDSKSYAVAAASILAKVTRDRLMLRYHRLFPHYHWDRNKGYPTKEHRLALEAKGYSPIHRRSFRWRKVSLADSVKRQQPGS